jgi:hypothetical protein
MMVTVPIGPYSRPHRLAKIDGRTKLAKPMRETRPRSLRMSAARLRQRNFVARRGHRWE